MRWRQQQCRLLFAPEAADEAHLLTIETTLQHFLRVIQCFLMQWKAHLQPPQPLPISGLPPQQQQHQQQHQEAASAASPPKQSAAQRLPVPPDLLA